MIGLKRGTIKLFPYNPKWEKLFEKEKQLLKKTFGDTIIGIEHIGSTAIPGVPAKPIIDIDVGVESLEIARSMKKQFEKLGYCHRPFTPKKTKEGLKWEELYAKGPEANRTHYVHVTVYENNYWKNDLLFRDYIRKNSVRAGQYTKLKEKLAKKYHNNREAYTRNKEQFINDTLNMAKRDKVK